MNVRKVPDHLPCSLLTRTRKTPSRAPWTVKSRKSTKMEERCWSEYHHYDITFAIIWLSLTRADSVIGWVESAELWGRRFESSWCHSISTFLSKRHLQNVLIKLEIDNVPSWYEQFARLKLSFANTDWSQNSSAFDSNLSDTFLEHFYFSSIRTRC